MSFSKTYLLFLAGFIQAFVICLSQHELEFEYNEDKVSNLQITGGDILLSDKEKKVNKILMDAKIREINKGFENPETYSPGMHFFLAKSLIRNSEVFRIIKHMPKGGLLHGHDLAIVSSKWIVRNLTTSNPKYCYDENDVLLLTFRNNSKCVTPLTSVCTARARSEDYKKFNSRLEKHITINTEEPEVFLKNSTLIMKRLENIFRTVNEFYSHIKVFCAYYKRLLTELLEDNIIYAELRSSLTPLYGTNKRCTSLDVAELIEEIVEDFKKSNPDFLGIKLIYAKRTLAVDDFNQRIKNFKQFNDKKPNFIIGLDLLGQEILRSPVNDFVNSLATLPYGTKFFLHAGETKWNGNLDWNLLHAILLGTKRIEHGFNLLKDPKLWKIVKSRRIAIEVNPISNQILRMVWDLRNHPGSFYISENLPIVISSDCPGIWNSKGLSFDFYYAFMSIASSEADLRTLKQFAINSLKYATLTKTERYKANEIFQKKWDAFLNDIIDSNY